MTDHTVSSNERSGRWTARCRCGWWTPCTGQRDAEFRMWEHAKLAEARDGMSCDCYDRDSLEYAVKPCPRCLLDLVLEARRAA